jgi:Protein of unknown function, DUF255
VVIFVCAELLSSFAADPNSSTENESQYINRLISERSPYLLQHAHKPVDWYPRGEEAFAATTGRGGWPMNVWLPPDLKPSLSERISLQKTAMVKQSLRMRFETLGYLRRAGPRWIRCQRAAPSFSEGALPRSVLT